MTSSPRPGAVFARLGRVVAAALLTLLLSMAAGCGNDRDGADEGSAGAGGAAGRTSDVDEEPRFTAADRAAAVALVRGYYEALIEQDVERACQMLSTPARRKLEQESASSRYCTANLKGQIAGYPDDPGGLTASFDAAIPLFLTADPGAAETPNGQFSSGANPEEALEQLRAFPGHAAARGSRLGVFFGNLMDRAVPVVREGDGLRIAGVVNEDFEPLLLDRDTPAGRLNACLLQRFANNLTDRNAEFKRFESDVAVDNFPDGPYADYPVGVFSYTVGSDANNEGGGSIGVTVHPTVRAAEYQMLYEQQSDGAEAYTRLGSVVVDWGPDSGELGEADPLPPPYQAAVRECAERSEIAF